MQSLISSHHVTTRLLLKPRINLEQDWAYLKRILNDLSEIFLFNIKNTDLKNNNLEFSCLKLKMCVYNNNIFPIDITRTYRNRQNRT